MTPTILVADDDHGLLAALKIRLEREGFRVVVCSDGYQSLAIARREHPDLLLLDVNMPAGSGFSVHDRLCTSDPLHHVPIIYMTGEAAGARDREAASHGGFALVHKPFEVMDLISTIWEALDAEQSASEDIGSADGQSGSFHTVQ